jgi:mono/diheme cytochrome c family protein
MGPMKAFIILVVIVVGFFFLFIYSGFYDIAASSPHSPVVKWIFTTIKVQSVHRYAHKVPLLQNQTETDFKEGFGFYDQTCIICHAAPGIGESDISKGLNPDPPEFAKGLPDWSEDEIFWVVKHGLKMTGMPAFGPTHSDKELAAVTRFLSRLPKMSPMQYKKLREEQRQKKSPGPTPSEGQPG